MKFPEDFTGALTRHRVDDRYRISIDRTGGPSDPDLTKFIEYPGDFTGTITRFSIDDHYKIFIDPDGGHNNKVLAQQIADANPSDTVELKWVSPPFRYHTGKDSGSGRIK